MGLDMYLSGKKYFKAYGEYERQVEDGFDVQEHTLALGYWRKHPNLHGYIVQEFANGVDKCQEIPLNEAALRKLIAAVAERNLPHTDGFFFGASDGSDEEVAADLAILNKALEWLLQEPPSEWRDVVYRASW